MKASLALSFSCLIVDGSKHLIQVVKAENDRVFYKDLSRELKLNSSDAFDVLHQFSFQELNARLDKIQVVKETSYSNLCFAFETHEHHLCAGMNYKDHVQESGQDIEMLLFPKHGELRRFGSAVPTYSQKEMPELLDHEIELGVIFDRDIRSAEDIKNSKAAFFVTNDFSDRSSQIFYFGKSPNNESYSFAAGKSKEGYSLASPILVIPEHWQEFYRNLDMKLWVNGELRQNSSTSYMSRSIEEMMEMALQESPAKKWPLLRTNQSSRLGEEISLLPLDSNGKLYFPKGSVFMTGTPGGTIFQKPSWIQILKAALSIPFLKLPDIAESFQEKLKASLISQFDREQIFLQSGDRIESEIVGLGRLNFGIGKSP